MQERSQMSDRERGVSRLQGGARRGETVSAAQAEVVMERAVGEPLLAAPGAREAESLLRPQQGRSVVWRWHVRRRRSAG